MTANAHTPNESGRWQPLKEHLDNVARLASELSAAFDAQEPGYWLGLSHDLGKYSTKFQDYLDTCAADPTGHHQGPDHKAAGTTVAQRHVGMASLVIQGHHGGLRTTTEMTTWLNAKRADTPIDEAIARARSEIPALEPERPIALPDWIRYDPHAAELFIRLLFSALVDADSLDTEQHWRPDMTSQRGSPIDLGQLWQRFAEDREEFARARATSPTNPIVENVRNAVYRDCLRAAETSPGLFRLNVPTGGGKTRSAMAFALRHAMRNGQRRIIVAVPFITITEQTADTYRRIFERPGDAQRCVLEHHSGANQTDQDEDDSHAGAVWTRLAAENWDAPIVVTTTVQLFESLFSNMRSKSRKVHRLANSVIILDEAQALPIALLDPMLDALRNLCEHYGSTVVLSTATQPAFDAIPVFSSLVGTDIVPNAKQHYDQLRRVTYEWMTDPALDWMEIAELLRSEPQALAVLNTKADALALLEALDDPAAMHLSTLLCGAHRKRVIAEVRERLRAGDPCRLVSTQVVEAGVDLDFPLVVRANGPLDAIIQAAGRCNREGLLGRGRVIVVKPTGGGLPPGSYTVGAGITESLLHADMLDPDDPSVATTYFRRLLGRVSTDDKLIQPLRKELNYPLVAERFRMIEPSESVVITTYGSDDDRATVRQHLEKLKKGTTRARYLLRELQPFTVSVPIYLAERYRSRRLISPILPGIGEWHGRYDSIRGIVANTGEAIIV